jgi:mRNA-degrading endonuclease RelE of RelBE toxin-antitoxin system
MWKLDKMNTGFVTHLGVAAQNNFDIFQNAIHNDGLHPKEAAKRMGGANFKQLSAKANQYQVRLSQGERVSFQIDESTSTVKILQVGGHT